MSHKYTGLIIEANHTPKHQYLNRKQIDQGDGKLILNNDKEIVICTAGSRKATVWKPQKLMWSGFINKVSQFHESPETVREFKAMKPSQQDELKDVGGYVGGELIGTRRKADSVASRCLVTLDADNIASGETERVIKTVSALECAYVIYSTRKPTGEAPRLRIVFPTDRNMSAEEYEPVARKMAELLGMPIFDPTTFQSSRFMYWASKCSERCACCLCSRKKTKPYVIPERNMIETVYAITSSFEVLKMVKAFWFCDEHFNLFKTYYENGCESQKMDKAIEETCDLAFLDRLQQLFDDMGSVAVRMRDYVRCVRTGAS